MDLLPIVPSLRPLIPGTHMGLRTSVPRLVRDERVAVVVQGIEFDRERRTPAVATVAAIAAIRSAPGGTSYIDVEGERLVRLGRFHPNGRVEAIPIDSSHRMVPPGLLDSVQRALRTYLAVRIEAGEPGDLAVRLSDDPVAASHEVASILRISWPEVQELLEAGSVGERLQRALLVLRRETVLLRSTLGWKGTM